MVLRHIHITGVDVSLEAGAGGTNLSHILRNAKKARTTADPAEQKLIVDEILITGTQVTATVGLLPGASAKATLLEEKILAVGAESGGVTPKELTALILARVADETMKATVEGGIQGLLENGEIKIDADRLQEGLKGLLKKGESQQ